MNALTPNDIAGRLNLARTRRGYRGDCPACGYAGTLVLTARGDDAALWCASCRNPAALRASVQDIAGGKAVAWPERAPKPGNDAERTAKALRCWEGATPAENSPARLYLAARGLPPGKLGPAARERLLEHRWPGNVRELENVLERALILAGEDELRPEHVASGAAQRARRAADVLGEGFSLDAFERELLHAALERAGGNKTHAARMLGVTRRRLYSLLASHTGERDAGSEET